MHESFLSYRNYFFLKQASALCLLSLVLYLVHSPAEPPNGGTWLGYSLGGIGAAIIFFLLWYGVRKRQYHLTANKQSAWVSAHVYLGSTLVLIVTLHCGLQFGWNIHTLTYALMLLVVASGAYGLYAYLVFPGAITRMRKGRGQREILKEISTLDESCLSLANEMGEQIHHLILLMVESTTIGGTAWQQLSGKSKALDFSHFSQVWPTDFPSTPAAKRGFQNGMSFAKAFLERTVVNSDNPEQIDQAGKLLVLLMQRNDAIQCLRKDVRYHALMKVWLYLHVPLSIALLATLLIHVIVVFFYW
jgi:hypothetical protein